MPDLTAAEVRALVVFTVVNAEERELLSTLVERYRIATVAHQWPVAPLTLFTGILEIVLLAGAVVSWRSLRT